VQRFFLSLQRAAEVLEMIEQLLLRDPHCGRKLLERGGTVA
jgi:hypothetical protein